MALTAGQLNYWKNRTGRPKLTLGQAAFQRAQARAAKPPTPQLAGPSPADKTWTVPNASGLTGQQQLYSAYMAKNPGAQLPTPAGGIPPADQTADPESFKDSTYWATVGQQNFNRQTQEQQLRTQGEEDQTNTQEALRRFREQLPRQEEGATNAANKSGLLYSGTLGRNLGDLRVNAIRGESDMQGAYDSRARAREAARVALENGGTLEEATAAAQAVDRQTTRDTGDADTGSLVAESPIPTDNLDAGVDVGTPSPKSGGRANTNRTPQYLPRGYSNWSAQQRSRYWARRRKARR